MIVIALVAAVALVLGVGGFFMARTFLWRGLGFSDRLF